MPSTLKRTLCVVLFLATLAVSAVSAQESDVPTIAIENGFDSGYNLNLATPNIGSSWRLSLCIGLAQKIDAQFAFLIGDGTANFPAYRLLGLDYFIGPALGLSVYVGQETIPGTTVVVNAVTGMGMFLDVFSRTLPGALRTSLRIRADYLTPVTDVSKGLLRFGLAAIIGI